MLELRPGRGTRPLAWSVLAAAIVASTFTAAAHAQMRVVNYNVAQMRGDDFAIEDVFLALDFDDKPGFTTQVALYVFQEVRNADVDDLFDALPPDYALATYTNFGEDTVAGAQAAFYNVNMLDEIESAHADITTGAGRRADRWKFQLVGYDSPDAAFYVYGMHLKAGGGASDVSTREAGADAVRINSSTLPVDTHIIYTGDMNFGGNFEAGYDAFLAIGPFPGQGFDPLGSGSWSGPSNAAKHSQSPCENSCLPDLISGGMDDRFDFQILTYDFLDAEGLSIIAGTYRSLGNDGQHYNDAINDGNNFYYPGELTRSNSLADDVHDASDHLPVVVDYQIPAIMNGFITPDFGRVIQGATVDVTYLVLNQVDVDNAIGGDTLDFVASGSDGIVGVEFDSIPALGAPFSSSMAVDTSIAADINATLNLFTLSEGAQNGQLALGTSGTVLRPSNPSFESGSDVNQTTVAETFDADTGVRMVEVDVHNFGFDALQSLLDVDGVSALSSPFGFTGGLTSGVGGGNATLVFSLDTTGLSGLHETVVTIDTSDEDVPGETIDDIEVTLSVTVDTGVACETDFNGSGVVDVVDLLTLLAAWGPCVDCPEDTDGNGFVDVVDLLALLAAWGPCS